MQYQRRRRAAAPSNPSPASIMNPGGIRADLPFNAPDGKVTYGDAFTVQPFGNSLVTMPLIRTFAPFVAGVARMRYARFAMFNVSGALLWVVSLTLAGYWFGNLPWVKQNLTLVILAIIAISLAPVAVAWVKSKMSGASNPAA